MKAEKKLLGQCHIHLSTFYTFQYIIWIYREKKATSVTVNLSTLSCFVQFVDMPVNKLRMCLNKLVQKSTPYVNYKGPLIPSQSDCVTVRINYFLRNVKSFFHGETINLLPYLTFVHFRAYWGMDVKGSYLHIYLKALRIL